MLPPTPKAKNDEVMHCSVGQRAFPHGFCGGYIALVLGSQQTNATLLILDLRMPPVLSEAVSALASST